MRRFYLVFVVSSFIVLFVAVGRVAAQTATPPPSTLTPVRTGTPYVPLTSTPVPPLPDLGDCHPELMGANPLDYDPLFYARCVHCFTVQQLYQFGCYDFWGAARLLEWRYTDYSGYVFPDPDVIVQGVFSYTLAVNDYPGTLLISYWDGAPSLGADLHILEIEITSAYTNSYISLPYEFMVIDDVRYLSGFVGVEGVPQHRYFDFRFWGWAGGYCAPVPTPTQGAHETEQPPQAKWYLQHLGIDVSSLVYDGGGNDDLQRSISISPGWLALVYQVSAPSSCYATLRWSNTDDPDLIRYGGSVLMTGSHYYCIGATPNNGACEAAVSAGLIPSGYERINPNPHEVGSNTVSPLYIVSRISGGSACGAGSQAQGLISYAIRYDSLYPVPTPTPTLTPAPTPTQLAGYCSQPIPADGLPLFVPPTFSPVDLGCYVLVPTVDTLPDWVPWWGLTVCLTGWDVGLIRFYGVDIDVRQLLYFYLFAMFLAYMLDKIYLARGGA